MENLDCQLTPDFEEFDFIIESDIDLGIKVRNLALLKGFRVWQSGGTNSMTVDYIKKKIQYRCSNSTYFD